MTRLTSTSSDRVKAVRALHERSGRRKAGRFLVEGPQPVRAALAAASTAPAGVVAREVFLDGDLDGDGELPFADIVAAAHALAVPVTAVSGRVLAAMAQTEQPQGVLVVCDLIPAPALADVADRDGPIVVLDAVMDPGNVGTIIRTAAAAGAAAVILGAGSADPHNGKVVRATAGALFAVPVVVGADIDDVAAAAHAAGRPVVVATGDAEDDLFTAAREGRLGPRACWVVGSEAHGVGAAARAAADLLVRIPMADGPESLNAGVAAAVALYVTAYATSGPSRAG